MPFDWREYLQVAKELVARVSVGHTSEAAARSAVSRAYYSSFGWVCRYAERNLGYQRSRRADEHVNLRDYLRKHGKERLASRLNQLRLWRNKCDYEDEVSNLDDHVRSAIFFAEETIQECG
jgi:hypothetical protein